MNNSFIVISDIIIRFSVYIKEIELFNGMFFFGCVFHVVYVKWLSGGCMR